MSNLATGIKNKQNGGGVPSSGAETQQGYQQTEAVTNFPAAPSLGHPMVPTMTEPAYPVIQHEGSMQSVSGQGQPMYSQVQPITSGGQMYQMHASHTSQPQGFAPQYSMAPPQQQQEYYQPVSHSDPMAMHDPAAAATYQAYQQGTVAQTWQA